VLEGITESVQRMQSFNKEIQNGGAEIAQWGSICWGRTFTIHRNEQQGEALLIQPAKSLL
jgi:hypothetical protein